MLPSYLYKIADCCSKNDIALIVTDDQSKDGSIAFLQQGNYKFTVNTGINHGYAANINHGIRYAQSQVEFDYYIVANNDISISEKSLSIIRQALTFISENDPKHGLIGVDEILEDRENYFLSFPFDRYSTDNIKQVTGIPGFFFIIRNELIHHIGWMDESYFMYGEDNDYFLRTLKAGFHIYQTGIPVRHYSEYSSSNSLQTSWFVYRNAFLYAQKNSGFIGVLSILGSFLNQIYNPFYKAKNPSNKRVRRNGFFMNNFLLVKSLLWNLRYYFRNTITKGIKNN